eukprot:2692209-Rhodomonas_salina.1
MTLSIPLIPSVPKTTLKIPDLPHVKFSRNVFETVCPIGKKSRNNPLALLPRPGYPGDHK